MSGARTMEVAAGDSDIRLDRWFKRHFPELGHGPLERLLRTGQVRVDGRRVKAGERLRPGQVVRVPPLPVSMPAPGATKPRAAFKIDERDAAALQRAVLHKDEHVIAIDKPTGLAVQGGPGLVRHLDAMLDALRFDAPERPRLVHRLDRDTSGVLLLARTAQAASALAAAFRNKETHKVYWAIVVGVPKEREGRIALALDKRPGPMGERVVAVEDGARSLTDYRVLDHAGKRAAWLELNPVTGRTHQLRAHCAAIGTPILGDGKYGGAGAFLGGAPLERRLHLHARAIDLPHPAGGRLRVVAPLPADLRRTWAFFGFDPDSCSPSLFSSAPL
jgi:23S rRNA pseudouridine955/2504/2580 synthase